MIHNDAVDITLRNTWRWSPLVIVAGIWAVVLVMLGGVDRDFLEFTGILLVGIAYIAMVQLRFRVILTGEGIAVRALRRRFIPRQEIAAIEVRRWFGGRRLTVVRADGTTERLPVPWPEDSRWNEMLEEAQQWVAGSRRNDASRTS
ncbi:hypothetical protein [Actinoallomurus sp. NPDC050550]|uniref:hypothetical protein n=1 Tax=Actinoallomurus sp. NPDC050550 TaxID=3154937 RepID=UPI00340D00ED